MKRLARRLHRRFRTNKGSLGRRRSGRSTLLEQLEPRQLLAADGLASAHSAVFEADTLNTIPFVVAGNDASPVAISFHVHATNGQLDPAAPEVRNEAGDIIPAMVAIDDYQGTNDSLIVVQLAAGSYQIGIGGEQSTTGEFDVYAGLPGDSSGNGQVTKSDYQHVTAAMVQSQFGFTGVSAQVFKKLGINTSQNLYRSDYDVDGDGDIDDLDRSVIETSVGAPTVTLEFMVDNQGPAITAAMVGDTGSSSSDGITNNLNATIDGTIGDTMPIISFTGSIDGSAAVELGTLLGQDFSSGGSFSINRTQLEQIAGNVTVTNNGSHTLLFSATDQQGNTSTQQLSFEFDTVAPSAPTSLDLDPSSDSGSSNSDNVTNLQQLLLRADAETNALVQFFSSLVTGSIGQGTANSPVSITSSTLPEGTQNITATATDAAGNTSGPSAGLSVTVDITAPATPVFELDEGSDTGALGDHLTTLSPVAFTGTTGANAVVELRRGGATMATGTANSSGVFTFSNVTLPFGASSFQVVATDAAGNSSTSTSQSFTRNDAPVVDNQQFAIDENRPEGFDVGTVAASDANIGEGDTLTYTITAGNTSGAFAINSSTGQITVANAAAIDFETTPLFQLTVQVTDHGGNGSGTAGTGLSDTATITIDLNDINDPPVVDDASFQIDENSAEETVVGTVVATDADDADVLTYEITDGNTDGAFAIDSETGAIRVANSAALDYETVPNHTFILTVMVTDTEQSSDMATVTITLNDVNDAPTAEDQSFDVSVKYVDDTVVGTVVADDQDNDSLTFEIMDGEFPEGAFTIDENSGEIHVFNADELEVGTSYTLVVQVKDEHDVTLAMPVTITLNAVANLPLTARDDDAATDEDTPINIDVRADNGHGADSDPDDPVGELTVSEHDAVSTLGATITLELDGTLRYDPTAVLDYLPLGEMVVDTFNYTIMDPGGATSSATVSVTVTGVNDPPEAQDDDVSTNEDLPIAFDPLVAHGHGPDFDPDDEDTIVLFSVANVSDLGVLLSLDGEGNIIYDPRSASMLQVLNDGEELVDKIDYTIVDGHGEISSATISVTVSGLSNDPIANDDELETDEDTPITFDPLTDHGNGADGDQDGDPVRVNGTSGTSDHGALIILNNDGTVTYDPTNSPELQQLRPGESIVDTFQYTITDDEDGTSIGTVTVTVTGLDDNPSFTTIPDQEMFAGAPLLLPLNGFDGDVQSLTFTAESEDGSLVEPIVYSTSRSLSITIAGYGEMRFYLFEELVPGVTQPIIDLVESGILDNTILHRLIPGFVVQGLDPTGTGFGHPGLPDFDDQFNADLQHTGSGYLSMAKGGDDTNSSQVFITDVNPIVKSDSYTLLRRLDFNHSVFGRLTIGESVRQAIMQATIGDNDKPDPDLVVEDIRIIDNDDVNAVLMLKSPNEASGTTNVTVTVADPEGHEQSQTFSVLVAPDQFNGVPFLTSYPDSATTTVDTDVEIHLEAFDDEGDDFTYAAAEVGLDTKILFDNGGDEAGITAPGTTDFSFHGSNWSGGEVATDADAGLFASGAHGYAFGSSGQVTFDVPVTGVEFYFTHSAGEGQQTATAFDADDNEVATWNSSEATDFNNADHFIADNFDTHITRIEFSGGHVDNFNYRNETVGLTFDIDQDTGVVTVTPPAGFTGTMAILVGVSQTDGQVDTVDGFDRQVVPITVLPAEPLTATEGGSGQAAESIGVDDPLLAEAFQAALSTWQTALGLSQLPDIRLNVADLGDARLGASSVVTVNSTGLPSSSAITIDDDGAGRGWHTTLDQAVSQDQYDLYTVLLHEVGHALGFHQAADSVSLADGSFDTYFDSYGHLVGLEDDLMSDTLPLGTRRLPSELDVELLQLAYGFDVADSSALDAAFADWNLAG